MRIFAIYRRQTGGFARAAEDCQPRGPELHKAGVCCLLAEGHHDVSAHLNSLLGNGRGRQLKLGHGLGDL